MFVQQKRQRVLVHVLWLFSLMLLVLLGVVGCSASPNATAADTYWRDSVQGMFNHGFRAYMEHAFPYDELQPVSCVGVNNYGGVFLTLVDSLDTLAIMGNTSAFALSVDWLAQHLSFDLDQEVSVFETNIRIVGGLLSAHLLASDKSLGLHPSYDGRLLPHIVDVVNRLMPAFDTPTGAPFGTINLRSGIKEGESRITATAGVGTFLLEFGILSILTGNDTYRLAADKAASFLFNSRSPIGLVGNHVDIFSGVFTHKDSGIGSGTDSFFEYLLKAYTLFGDTKYARMFSKLRRSINFWLRRQGWFFEAHMDYGTISWTLHNSLQSFWGGVETLAGHLPSALESIQRFIGVWRLFGATPEGFNILSGTVQSGQRGYPLRPELAESLYYLYRATRDPVYRQMGRDIVIGLLQNCWTACGFSGLQDVETKELNDRMDSFFLAETTKYLYLLFDDDNLVHRGQYVFNTEGHPFPVSVLWQLSEDPNPPERPLACRAPSYLEMLSVEELELPKWARTRTSVPHLGAQLPQPL